MSEGFACQGALWRLRVPPSCAGTHPFLSPNPFFLDRSSENPLLASTHRSAGRPTTPLALTFRRIRHEPPWRYIPSSSDLTLDQLPPLLPRSPRSAYPAAVLARLAFQKRGNVVRYFCLPQTKCHDGVGDGRETEEGRTCARGTGGFGKRESESESRSRHKVSGHSVGRGGAVRNTRTPPLSPRRPSRSAREASFRKWLQKHESFVVGVVGPRPFSRWPCSLAPPTAKRNANVWSGSDALSVSLSLRSLTSAARSGLTRDSQSVSCA